MRPISPARKGGVIYFHCALAGQKLENIKNNSAVCLAFVGKTHIPAGQFTIDYVSGVVFETAQMIEDREERIDSLRLIC